MNKFSIFVLSLALFACANSPDLRPDVYSKGERILLNGVIDYKKQNYTGAQQKFSRALMLYKSIDNSEGAQLARINLAEALLATYNFEAAEKQLTILKQGEVSGVIKEPLRFRVVLLEVKILFQKQQYHESLTVLEPLLLQSVQQETNDNKQLDLLAIAARLEVLMSVETEQHWLTKFREALLQERKVQAKFQVILKRIDAVIATQNKQYREALELLHEALTYYKNQVNRRAISACLEEIAEIELKQHNQAQALEYFNRALTIRDWLKDQYHIDKIQKRILKINQ